MAVKLFVSDLDGTLLPTGDEVSAKNIKAAQDMSAAGITVTIATGRMYKAALPVAKKLAVDVPIITYNGALIKKVTGEVVYKNCLAPDIVLGVLDFCKKNNWYVQLYSRDELYYAKSCAESHGYETAQKVAGHEVGAAGLRERTEDVTKLLLITKGAEETAARINKLQEHFADKLNIVKSNANYAEAVNPGVSKAAALKILAEKLAVPIEEVMAIGDSDNDLPMLKAAGKSIAMGNAAPEVQAHADYVTTSADDEGILHALEHCGII